MRSNWFERRPPITYNPPKPHQPRSRPIKELIVRVTIAAFVIALVAAFEMPSVSGQENAKPLLAQDATWVMHYDSKLDGKLAGKGDGEVRWKIAVRNNRLSGSLADSKDGDPADHRLAGEIAEGKPPIAFFRQDGPKGLVCYYSGKRIAENRLAGIWFDNRGGSGDFELFVETK